jgi:hypothetical protein
MLVLGPLLRHVGERDATVWVETDHACRASVHAGGVEAGANTFRIGEHHYALIVVDGLEPGTDTPYTLSLDGEPAWPPANGSLPACSIRTLDAEAPLTIVFGSCRLSLPHNEPYTLPKDEDDRGRGKDALWRLARRMVDEPREQWPELLLLLGDQVYADEVSPGALEFIHSRRDVSRPPGEEVADFEEYTRLYWDAWQDPQFRWLLATVPVAMIFDDHDIHDDWNTSAAWLEEMQAQDWWETRIVAGLVSYWVYQHIGNLAPQDLAVDEVFQRVTKVEDDAWPLLAEFAGEWHRRPHSVRWSFSRDLSGSRLVVIDSRAARVLDEDARLMVDDREWDWVTERCRGDWDHLLIGTSLPFLLAPGMHHLEAWSEAVCGGAWGRLGAKLGERLRQGADLEHWAAFGESFHRMRRLMEEVGAGHDGSPPASILAMSGDVHHAYLADVAFRRSAGVRSAVYQAVCSPVRNPLGGLERAMLRAAASPAAYALTRALARAAGVGDASLRWRIDQDLTFDNQIATLELAGRTARLRIEKVGPWDDSLEPTLDRVLA